MAADPSDPRRRITADPTESDRPNHADAVRKLFDDWARTGMADGMERRHRRLAELMLERVEVPPDARVLDIGCGSGWTARMLSPLAPEGAIVGIDPSLEMILRARRTCEGLENTLFAPAPAEQIPWAGDYFTHVLSIESAYYWTSTILAAREIYRVTAYGGSIHILINYYAENPYSEAWGREMGLSLHRLRGAEWAAVFEAAGFKDLATDQIPDDSPIPPGKPPAEHAQREGLQRAGALYVTGMKPPLPEVQGRRPIRPFNPFRIFR